MGKVVRYTGSKLLGEELRRMRGARALHDIVRLSKESPLTSRVQPISAPTLSQIENGITMPSTEMLYSLSVIYDVSPSRLLHLIVEERLISGGAELPSTKLETRDRLQAEMTRGNWYEALALAIHGARMATDVSERVLWNATRAMAIRRLGMRQDAIMLLIASTETAGLTPLARHIVHSYLGEAALEAGYIGMAVHHSGVASDLLPEDAPIVARLRTLMLNIDAVVCLRDFGRQASEAALRETQRGLQHALEFDTEHGLGFSRWLRLREGQLVEQLGNGLIAMRTYEVVAADAAEAGDVRAEVNALNALGQLHLAKKRFQAAESAFERAETRAVLHHHSDEAFEAYFGLLLVARALSNGREAYFRGRCQRYLPLVQARTASVCEFDRLQGRGFA